MSCLQDGSGAELNQLFLLQERLSGATGIGNGAQTASFFGKRTLFVFMRPTFLTGNEPKTFQILFRGLIEMGKFHGE